MIHPNIGTAPAEELTIRLAAADDLEPLRRLIDIDSGGGTRHMLLDLTRPGAPPRVLVASAGGNLIAAVHLDTGHSAADPFEQSATALELLRTRADQLGGASRSKRLRSRRSLLRMRSRSAARAS